MKGERAQDYRSPRSDESTLGERDLVWPPTQRCYHSLAYSSQHRDLKSGSIPLICHVNTTVLEPGEFRSQECRSLERYLS